SQTDFAESSVGKVSVKSVPIDAYPTGRAAAMNLEPPKAPTGSNAAMNLESPKAPTGRAAAMNLEAPSDYVPPPLPHNPLPELPLPKGHVENALQSEEPDSFESLFAKFGLTNKADEIPAEPQLAALPAPSVVQAKASYVKTYPTIP